MWHSKWDDAHQHLMVIYCHLFILASSFKYLLFGFGQCFCFILINCYGFSGDAFIHLFIFCLQLANERWIFISGTTFFFCFQTMEIIVACLVFIFKNNFLVPSHSDRSMCMQLQLQHTTEKL